MEPDKKRDQSENLWGELVGLNSSPFFCIQKEMQENEGLDIPELILPNRVMAYFDFNNSSFTLL